MAPQPSSPTSLIWAHQLKREHGILLKRMQELESANEKQENRLKSAESAASKAKSSTNAEISALTKQVHDLEDGGGLSQRLSDMESEVEKKIDDVQADTEVMTDQINALSETQQAADEERKEDRKMAQTKEKALLQRIAEVEAELKKYERTLDQMGKKINEGQFDQIKSQLEGLTKQVQREGSQMKMLSESVQALEAANQELKKANEGLEKQLEKIAKRSTSASAPTPTNGSAKPKNVDVETEADATPGADDERPRKKSHKWSGGGADRDIIKQGADFFGPSMPKPMESTTSKPKQSTAPARKSLPIPKPKKKTVPPPRKSLPGTEGEERSAKKSHRWAGGGADKDIIQAGQSQMIGTKRGRPADDVPQAPKPKALKRSAPPSSDVGQTIVRSGKGWIEYVEAPNEVPEDSAPVKRPRGRPRKTAPLADPELLTQDRTTRYRVHPKTPAEPATKRTKADPVYIASDHEDSLPSSPPSGSDYQDPRSETTAKPRRSSLSSIALPHPPSQAVRVEDTPERKLSESPDVLQGGATAGIERIQASPDGRREIIQSDPSSELDKPIG